MNNVSGTASPRLIAAVAAIIAVAVVAVSITAKLSHDRIERNEHAWFIAQLDSVLAGSPHDNNAWAEWREVTAPELSAQPVTVYFGRWRGEIVSVALTVVAPDGYRGPISLLVGAARDGQILGVRVIEHEETPGLGDAFAATGSTWLRQFTGRSLQSTPESGWTIKKDGGEFDQFTSASITPRAIVKGVQAALKYVQDHRAQLFGP